MELNFSRDWEFAETPLDTAYIDIADHEWNHVDLPHDFLITDVKNLYRDATGWYRKRFSVPDIPAGEHLFLSFDGLYMDSRFYLNGEPLGEWKYGYSACLLDLTEKLLYGEENTLIVSVRHQSPNSRWYSGAGIFRKVKLIKKPATYLVPQGIYFHAEKIKHTGPKDSAQDEWEVTLRAEIDGEDAHQADIVHTLYDADGRILPWKRVFSVDLTADAPFIQGTLDRAPVIRGILRDTPRRIRCVETRYRVKGVTCWDTGSPVLYTVRTELSVSGRTDSEPLSGPEKEKALLDSLDITKKADTSVSAEREDEECTRVGFRTVVMDPSEGLFLNGKRIKLNGVCEHHDLGALGAAFHRTAFKRKLKKLRAMGVNAVRLTHNMAAVEVLKLADEMGFLLISEAFDMWMRPKTDYDYARFFADWHKRDVESWIRRDRNHPSVILWSIGNEIYDTHADKRGQRLTADLKALVEAYDPMKNARVTSGSNYMPWEGAQKCAEILKIVGYNYAEKVYEEHHKEHPDWVIYGSETASIVSSRGVYHFPLATMTLSEEDQQCSSLGNSCTSWGAHSWEECAAVDRDTPYSMGQFLWSGFDYIGEPTPYQTKNSYFGQIDTAGFPKDSYYFWQSVWTDPQKAPMVHIIPGYWDFNEGQIIDVRVVSNLDQVELFINDRSLGKKPLTHKPGTGHALFADYRIPYEPGALTAVAYAKDGSEAARDEIRSFGDTAGFMVEREPFDPADDLLFFDIGAVDADHHPVGNASDRVRLTVTGPGRLIGTDNGDSTDTDSYQSAERKLFNGRLLAIVKPEPGADKASVGVSAERAEAPLPVRSLKILPKEGQRFTADRRTLRARVTLHPANASDQEIECRLVNDTGVESNLAEIESVNRTEEGAYMVTMTAKGDGSFRLRAVSKDGAEFPRILSELEYQVEGVGQAFLDPYAFVSASLYSSCIGEVGCGNEKGISSAREETTVITWSGLDFGRDFADRITIPIFTLNDEPYSVQIWRGIPGEEGAKLLVDGIYQKKSIWNVYQEETWELGEHLTGIETVSIRVERKFHIKGFTFHRIPRAFAALPASGADTVYGDQFRREGETICDIGNNVTISFRDMDFGEKGAASACVTGRCERPNSVHIRFTGEDGSVVTQLVEFPASADFAEHSFLLSAAPGGVIRGRQTVDLVFLPGTKFDLAAIRFTEGAE